MPFRPPLGVNTGDLVVFDQLSSIWEKGDRSDVECANQLLVRSLSNLPTPFGGRIQLPDDTLVIPCGVVDLEGNTLAYGDNTVIDGVAATLNGFQTNSVDALINASGGQNGQSHNMCLVNSGGPVFDFDGDGLERFIISNVLIMDSLSAGVVRDVSILSISSSQFENLVDGLSVDGTIVVVELVSTLSLVNPAGYTFVTLEDTAVLTGGLSITDCVVLNPVGRTAFNLSALATVPLGLVRGNTITAGGTALAGVTKATAEYFFQGNIGILDSVVLGNMAFTGNLGGEDTVISVQGTFVRIGNGNNSHPLFVAAASNERFSVQGATTQLQVLRYDGIVQDQFSVRAYAAVQPDVGGALGYAIRLTQNGSPIANTEIEGQTGSVNQAAGGTYTEGTVTAAPGDEFTIEIANLSGTQDLDVAAALITAGVAA